MAKSAKKATNPRGCTDKIFTKSSSPHDHIPRVDFPMTWFFPS